MTSWGSREFEQSSCAAARCRSTIASKVTIRRVIGSPCRRTHGGGRAAARLLSLRPFFAKSGNVAHKRRLGSKTWSPADDNVRHKNLPFGATEYSTSHRQDDAACPSTHPNLCALLRAQPPARARTYSQCAPHLSCSPLQFVPIFRDLSSSPANSPSVPSIMLRQTTVTRAASPQTKSTLGIDPM